MPRGYFNWLTYPDPGTRIDEMFPLLGMVDNRTALTKEGELVQAIDIQGKDYTGLDPEQSVFLFELRKQVFEMAAADIVISAHSLRYRINEDASNKQFDNALVATVNTLWAQQFRSTYRWRHVLILRTAKEAVLDRLAHQASRSLKQKHRPLEDQMGYLTEITQSIVERLNDFGPKWLTESDFMTYWATVLNGKQTLVKEADYSIDLTTILAGVDLYWPDHEAHQEYVDVPSRYSAWLGIKAYPGETSATMLRALYQLPVEMGIYQSFRLKDKERALKIIKERQSVTANFRRNAGIVLLELGELASRIEAEELKIGDHTWAVQIFADSKEALKSAVAGVKNAIEARGIRVLREKNLQEPLFWSIFPGLEHFNVRVRPVTTENLAHFITFSNAGEGLNSCSFGAAPVTLFKTETESTYSFTFHTTSEPQALGNTLVIGGSNTGKTTLISFLLAMCHQYKGFRCMCFDRLHGMEIFTRMLGGSFNDFASKAECNPFQLKDNPLNRAFLVSWLQLLTGKDDDISIATATNIVNQSYLLKQSERQLAELLLAFGKKEKGSIREGIDKWLPGGAYGEFFNGKRDALSFKSRLATFDMTLLLDMPEALVAMSDYLFHRMKMAVLEEPGSHAIFVDELNKYIESSIFAPRIKETVSEIRKTNGIFIGAAQSAKTILQTAVGREIQASIASYLLFPDATAEEQYYRGEGINLTRAEFEWVRNPSYRQVMLKRRGGESVILDVNLAGL